MQNWNSLIDPSWFGLIAGYLRSPRSPIDYLVHVKDRERLPDVAERIMQDLAQGGFKDQQLSPGLQALLQDGAIKVSSRLLLPSLGPDVAVDPATVRSSAPCEVLYVPPCYVVHTPGLFEEQAAVMVRDAGRSRMSGLQRGKDIDYGHGY
ncbi:MAG: hypothetical protein H7A47_15280 [Verrucomicrobiales bacterium]|nr:hypothetical protein [Verrucomicrobiales bacterium]